jgi:hypothetical protein
LLAWRHDLFNGAAVSVLTKYAVAEPERAKERCRVRWQPLEALTSLPSHYTVDRRPSASGLAKSPTGGKQVKAGHN